jgi:hypothetical protein
MPDYYSLVAKAAGALDPNTVEARREVYERARAALLSEVQKLVPTWERSEIMAEQLFLELAIGEVEAELQSLASDPRRLDKAIVAPRDEAALDPKLPTNHKVQRRSGSLGAAPLRNVHQPCSEAAARDQRPRSPIEESDCVRDTWMTELLARASGQPDEDVQDFAPKHGSSRVVGHPSFRDSERPTLRKALALWSQGYAACR